MRSNGEGAVTKRPDGRWQASIRHTDQDGNKTRPSVYGKTRAEAVEKLAALRTRLNSGAPAVDSNQTLETWVSHWLDHGLAVSDRKPTTQATYRTLMNKHLVGSPVGKKPLRTLRPSDLDRWAHDLRQNLADSSINKTQTILGMALSAAVRDGLLAASPYDRAQRTTPKKREVHTLNAEEVRAVLTAAEGSRSHDILYVIAALGLRRGEALALQWTDIRGDRLTVTGTLSRVNGALVRTAPKTAKSRRTLPLSPPVKSLLEDQPRRSAYVFTTDSGGPIDPQNILRDMKKFSAQAGVEANVHTLRHAAVVALLEAGVHLRAVADLMGHSDIRMTAEIYASLSSEQAITAMDILTATMTPQKDLSTA